MDELYATEMMDVVETCTRDRRDVVGEGKMRINNETVITGRVSRRNQVTIREMKSRIVDFIYNRGLRRSKRKFSLDTIKTQKG